MKLTPREKDKLLVAMAAEVARKRLARGVKLNYPEAIALITDAVVEGGARRPLCCGHDGGWRAYYHPRAMHGGHLGNDPRCADRSHFSRRHKTRDRPQPHSLGGENDSR